MSRPRQPHPLNTPEDYGVSSPSPSLITAPSVTSLSPLAQPPAQMQPPDLPLIVPIDQRTVKQLVAGQAVMDLASIVKELVDNALDAGAKSINIRLFNQGLDIVEVTDDGSGVPPDSRELLAMKHATSKIRTFSDIYSCSETSTTLGFRGEALFSLANTSQNLVVATRTANEEMGEKMMFNSQGFVRAGSLKPIARKVGTTVAVVKPFDALPVRRADFAKRIKFHRNKLMKMIQGYAIFATGVRLNLIDISGEMGNLPSRTEYRITTSERSTTIKQRVCSVLGSSFTSGLSPISVDLAPLVRVSNLAENNPAGMHDELVGAHLGAPMDKNKPDSTTCSDADFSSTLGASETAGKWRIEGYVSNSPVKNVSKTAEHGTIARDLQFFCIDGRPVDMPRVSRVLLDVWKSVIEAYGYAHGTISRKRPACILSFHMPVNMYDVNLSPDKREVLMVNESYILNLLKDALRQLWLNTDGGAFEENQVELSSNNNPVERDPSSEERRTYSKMERRNAFVNDPSTVGKAAPDSSHVALQNQQIQSSPHQLAKATASVPPNAYGVGAESSTYSIRAADDLSCFSKTTGLDFGGDKEQRNWNQTKLQFNRSSNPEDDDPQRARVGDAENMRSAKTNNMTDHRYAAQDTPQVYEHHAYDGTRTKQAHKSGSQPSRLSQFAYESAPSGGNISGPTAMATVVNSSPADNITDAVSSGNNETYSMPPADYSGETNSKEKINVTRQTNTSQDGFVAPNVRHKTCRKRKATQSPSEGATQSHRADGNGHARYPKAAPTCSESNPSPSVPVVWSSFRGTADVIRLSRSSRKRMRHTQELLRKAHIAAKEGNNQYVGNDAPKTGVEESVGVSPNEEKEDSLSTASEPKSGSSKRKSLVHLNKDDFLGMEVVGQFNLGFILARCRNHHLWILDQHACDEKFNFERLCKTTVIHEQKLIAPLPLELSPSEEHTILENIEVFEQNGFRFSYDCKKPPRHRLALTALPHSGSGGGGKKAVQFGKEDVGALCAMLGADGGLSSGFEGGGAGYGTGADGNGMFGNNAVRRYAGNIGLSSDGANLTGIGGSTNSSIVRLPKAIAMFASRACRGSIMIGTALSQKEMEALVRKMIVVDEPWNCPHGRPTMRHVKGLLDCLIEDSRTALEHVAGPSMALLSQDPGNSRSPDDCNYQRGEALR